MNLMRNTGVPSFLQGLAKEHGVSIDTWLDTEGWSYVVHVQRGDVHAANRIPVRKLFKAEDEMAVARIVSSAVISAIKAIDKHEHQEPARD